jgi:bacterioferritin-associated ferredoxin
MWVCHCRGLSDRDIRHLVELGHTDEHAIGDACGAGRHCGGCRPEVRRICEALRDSVGTAGVLELCEPGRTRVA